MTSERERPLRVLLLEDSPNDAELLLRALARGGYRCDAVRVETLAQLAHELDAGTWDVIIADFKLVGFTALEALDVVKRTGKDIPFILVSGSVGEEIAAAAMRSGAHDFFLKSRVTRLGPAIERELREAESRRERREAVARLERSEDELRQAVQARDEFLSIASHELKTPLTPLSLQLASALELVRECHAAGRALPPERVQGKLAKAARQVERLTALVNSLLDVTRLTSGRFAIARSRVELGAVVRSVVDRSREGLDDSASELTLRIEGPVIGSWDKIGIEAVVSNLVSNALKFGEGRPIEVAIGCERDMAWFSIADHGIGIPPDAFRRIFQRFERAVPAQHYGGFGIGLWVARQIVEAHGGTIHVSSERSAGTTFTVELPLALAEGAPA